MYQAFLHEILQSPNSDCVQFEMGTIFCCSSVKPYRPAVLQHEAKFSIFITWAKSSLSSSIDDSINVSELPNASSVSCFVIQVVCQVNYGLIEWKNYFAKVEDFTSPFRQVSEDDLIAANYMKLNS